MFTPVIVVLLLFFLWWVDIPIRKRDSIISETVHEIMDEVVGRDAKKVGRKVENSIVYHDLKEPMVLWNQVFCLSIWIAGRFGSTLLYFMKQKNVAHILNV